MLEEVWRILKVLGLRIGFLLISLNNFPFIRNLIGFWFSMVNFKFRFFHELGLQ
jgi:hypothetical protein